MCRKTIASTREVLIPAPSRVIPGWWMKSVYTLFRSATSKVREQE